ncbi:MAG: 1,4-dihydroxy-6-naphthoate synthase [Acidobacteriota bacterium]|nr:1,4-dihydroxy-6-naphthoate synthase [Acidobacteriota bacterium]
MLPEQIDDLKKEIEKLLARADVCAKGADLSEHLRAILWTFDLPTTREGLVKRKKRCRTKPIEIARGFRSGDGFGSYYYWSSAALLWCPTLNTLLIRDAGGTGEDNYLGIPAREQYGIRVPSLDDLTGLISRNRDVLRVHWPGEKVKFPSYGEMLSDMIIRRDRFMATNTQAEAGTITVAHSPDSDDAFMFYALATNKLDTGELKFTHVLKDIQTLNDMAMRSVYDVTAISFHAYAYIADKYALLPHGASIGDNYGPIVVSREPVSAGDLSKLKIAVPGRLTSAFLALRIFNSDFEYEVVPFDQIIESVQDGRYDAGLLIHEGQIFYDKLGLHKVIDLGEWWHEWTGLPLPMGGTVIRRSLGPELIADVSQYLRQSIAYALEHRDDALKYAMQFARDMDVETADRFVGMWVNQLTLDYTDRGRMAVRRLLDEGFERGIIPNRVDVEFAA